MQLIRSILHLTFMKASILTLLFIIYAFNIRAQTAQSAYITYSKSGNDVTVLYHIIMGGNDSAFHSSRIGATISCKSGASINLSGLTEIEKNTISINCNYTEKAYQYVFKKEINLNDTAYAAIEDCCELELGLSLNFRDTSINTLQKKPSTLYVYTHFNACGSSENKHSAEISTAYLNHKTSLNQPHYFNIGAFDIADYDSLSLELTSPLESKTDSMKFVSSLHSKLPFSPYYPGSLAYPYKNPTASPPIGFTFDATTGDIIYTPTKLENGPLVIKIKEWRTINGTTTQVGEMVVETLVETIISSNNNAPTLTGPYHYQVCEGETLCFDITTNDVTYIPPPPSPSPMPDTVKISWNRGIPAASFSVINPTARLQTGRFCWTPKSGDASNLPYAFTATARDNHCPLNAVTTRRFFVSVMAKAEVNVNLEQKSNKYSVSSSVPNAVIGQTYSFQYRLLDNQSNEVMDSSIGFFVSSNSGKSNNKTDTINFYKSDTYILETTLKSGQCTTTVLDTIRFSTNGITERKAAKLVIFPNPTSSEVKWNGALDLVKVYNSLGQEVYSKENDNKIIVSDWIKGVYTMQGHRGDELFIGKFVVD